VNDLTVVLLFHAQTHHAETKNINTTAMRKCYKCKCSPIHQMFFTSTIKNTTERRLGGGYVKFLMLLKERNLWQDEVLTVVLMKIQDFWDIMSCQLAKRHYGAASCLRIQGPKDLGLL
jgi:hypothetical protein